MAREIPETMRVNEVLTLHMVPEFILVNLSANFADKADADHIKAAVARLDKKIIKPFPRQKK